MSADSYLQIKKHIKQVALECGRDPATITLVAVTKGHPWPEVLPLYQEGCRNFGESRLQEAEIKMTHSPSDVHWHFIGPLQKNKVRKVVDSFYLIHSVDSVELAQKISACSQEAGVISLILLEANTSGEASKHGLSSSQWKQEFDKVRQLPGIQVKGLMTMAPLVQDEKVIRHCFAKLRELRNELQKLDPAVKELSMGMSHDYPYAIQEGATILRVGTALFTNL